MIRFVIEKIQDKINLSIIEAHVAGDGKSLLILMREILNNLSEIEQGVFSYTDKPMIPLKLLSKDELSKDVQVNDLIKCSFEEYNRSWEDEKRVITYEDFVKVYNQYWANHETNVKTVNIKKEILDELIISSRENQVSINSVILTAAAKELVDPSKMIVVADARPKDVNGMGNYFGGVQIESLYDLDKTFWENARYIHNQLHMQLTNRNATLIGRVFTTLLDCNLQNAILLNESGCYECKTAKAYNDIYSIEKNNISLAVSNLGSNSMTSKFGNIEVKDAKFFSPLRPGADGIMAILTVNGEMNITLGYNKDRDIDYEKLISGIEEQLVELVGDKESSYLYQLL